MELEHILRDRDHPSLSATVPLSSQQRRCSSASLVIRSLTLRLYAMASTCHRRPSLHQSENFYISLDHLHDIVTPHHLLPTPLPSHPTGADLSSTTQRQAHTLQRPSPPPHLNSIQRPHPLSHTSASQSLPSTSTYFNITSHTHTHKHTQLHSAYRRNGHIHTHTHTYRSRFSFGFEFRSIDR